MKKFLICLFMTTAALVMIYPLLWLVGASFKSNEEIAVVYSGKYKPLGLQESVADCDRT